MIFKNLDVAKASGIDRISTKFLKDGSSVITIHLANVINLSIKLDPYPLKCKIVKIKSLFKKVIKTEGKIYRPNSLLPLIPKGIERPIHNQTQNYLQRNELLYIYQLGFRLNHFTDPCFSRLTDMILNSAEMENILLRFFIDFRKALFIKSQ